MSKLHHDNVTLRRFDNAPSFRNHVYVEDRNVLFIFVMQFCNYILRHSFGNSSDLRQWNLFILPRKIRHINYWSKDDADCDFRNEVRRGIEKNLTRFLTARITDETRSFICWCRCQRVKIMPEWRRNDGGDTGVSRLHRANQDQGPSIACVTMRHARAIAINSCWLSGD